MKVSKFKVAFAVLLIATIVWAIAFYYTLQGYREYCERFDESPWSEWGLRDSYLSWNGGKYVIFTGGFLLVAWIGFAGYGSQRDFQDEKRRFSPLPCSYYPLEACHRLAPIEGQKENKKRKRGIRMEISKFRLTVLVLLAVTVIYAVVFALSVQSL